MKGFKIKFRIIYFIIFILILLSIIAWNSVFKDSNLIKKLLIQLSSASTIEDRMKKEIILPKPDYKGRLSVEEAIYGRQSIRKYSKDPLSLREISQMLWSANGINIDGTTGPTRSYPSAGGLYPLDIYLAVFNVKNLGKGLYKYIPEKNKLRITLRGDLKSALYEASYYQNMFGSAAEVIIYAYDYSILKRIYDKRGIERYAHMDIGHSAENVYLQAESLGIGTVAVGAFNDIEIEKILNIKDKEILYLLPIGKKNKM